MGRAQDGGTSLSCGWWCMWVRPKDASAFNVQYHEQIIIIIILGDIVLELIEEGEERGDGGGERDEEGGEARIQRVEADANFVTLR